MRAYNIDLTDRQAEHLVAEAKRLDIPLDELIRRILDAWVDERQTRPYLSPPFRFVPVDPGTGAPPPPSPWTPNEPFVVYGVGEGVPVYAVRDFGPGETRGTVTWEIQSDDERED